MKPEQNDGEEGGRSITPRTMIPLGTAAAVLLVLFSGQQWLSARLNAIDKTLESLKDAWTVKDQEIFVLKLDKNNPTLRVPDVSEVRHQ